MNKRKKIICGIGIVCIVAFASTYLLYERSISQIKDKAFASDDNKVNTNTSNLTDSQNNDGNSTNNTTATLQNNSTNTNGNTSSSSNNNKTSNASNSTSSNSSNATNSAAENTSNAASSENNTNAKDYTAYFGEWRIVKSIGTLPIYAMSKEDIDKYIGKKIALSKSKFTDVNGTVQSPKYEEKTVPDSDFFDENRRQLSYIGVTGNSTKKLVIYDPNGNIYNQIYLINSKSIVFLWDGVFFELQK